MNERLAPTEIHVGRFYKHYKGGKYEVLAIGMHSETKEKLVIYRNLEHGSIWVRPASMWFDSISDGYATTDRFTLLGDS